jgi:hypothetical protein
VEQRLKPLEVAVGLVKEVLLQTKMEAQGVGVRSSLGLPHWQELEFPAKAQMAVLVTVQILVMQGAGVVVVLVVLDLPDLLPGAAMVEAEQ